MKKLALFAMALICLAPACPPAPVPPPLPDVADAAVYDAASYDGGYDQCAIACITLGVLGCPEGGDQGACYATCRHVNDAQLTNLAPACVAKARTPAELRNCGPAWKKGCAGR